MTQNCEACERQFDTEQPKQFCQQCLLAVRMISDPRCQTKGTMDLIDQIPDRQEPWCMEFAPTAWQSLSQACKSFDWEVKRLWKDMSHDERRNFVEAIGFTYQALLRLNSEELTRQLRKIQLAELHAEQREKETRIEKRAEKMKDHRKRPH